MRSHHLLPLVAVVAALVFGTACSEAPRSRELTVRCAASFEDPVRELADAFRVETGIALRVTGGPSIDLAKELKGPHPADLYLFDDEELAFSARKLGVAREVLHLAVLRPVLVAPTGNPAGITELADLSRAELRVGVPDPEHCGLGLHVRTSARYIGAWHQVQSGADLLATTESQLAHDLAAGQLDVGVVWDATANRTPGLERIEELKLEGHARRLTVAVATAATHVSDALCFARWLRSADRAQPIFESNGFTCITGGDRFVRNPSVRVFLAARFRAAAEPALEEWSHREGAKLELVVLSDAELAKRSAEELPNALVLFDDRRFDAAGPRFADREWISSDPLTLVVYGMNPEGVRNLSDLTLPGLRVGTLARDTGEPGELIWNELDRTGIGSTLRESPLLVTAQEASTLLEAVRLKELDVALLHGTLAGPPTMRNDVIPLVHPAAELNQRFALRSDQEFPELAARLRDSIRTSESNERFFHLGYRWHPRDPAAAGEQ